VILLLKLLQCCCTICNCANLLPTVFKPQIKAEIAKYKVGAPARVGLVAPNDVTIPAGGTGMDPSQTSFFQALAIATKINKGAERWLLTVRTECLSYCVHREHNTALLL
jgi:hypothetical protein